jgi:hypothetical protein
VLERFCDFLAVVAQEKEILRRWPQMNTDERRWYAAEWIAGLVVGREQDSLLLLDVVNRGWAR